MTGRAVELSVGGMTWASCAARIERKLNRLDGVDASVNFATEKAHVAYSGAVTAEDLVRVVEQTGYTARLSQPLSAAGLGLRLQRGRPAAGRAGAAQPDERRRGHGLLQRVRGVQQPPAAPVRTIHSRRRRHGHGPARPRCPSPRSPR